MKIYYGDFKLKPEVVRPPHFEGPYPQLKRGQQHLGALVAVVRPFRYIYVTESPCETLDQRCNFSHCNLSCSDSYYTFELSLHALKAVIIMKVQQFRTSTVSTTALRSVDSVDRRQTAFFY